MQALIRSYLAQLPGEFEKEVNILVLAEIFAEAEMPGGVGIKGVLTQMIARADDLFPDAAYRPLAVKSLTLLSNIVSHKAASSPAPAH